VIPTNGAYSRLFLINNNNDEDCGIMRWDNSLYGWNDGNCKNIKLYICEK
jgi:hypothetical protein